MMKQERRLCVWAMTVAAIVVPSRALVGTQIFGPSPQVPKTFYSANGEFAIEISPPESDAFAGTSPDVVEDGVLGETPRSQPRVLVFRSEAKEQPTAEFSLRDHHVPWTALISNDGAWVVAIPGRRAPAPLLTIYSSDGTVVRSLSVEDVFTAEDAIALGWARAPTATAWLVGMRIDEAGGVLVLNVDSCHPVFSCDDPPASVGISLVDGTLVGPKRHLVTHYEPSVRVGASDDPADDALVPEELSCRDGYDQETALAANLVELEALRSSASVWTAPEYTRVGRVARISGRVVLELVVAPDGRVVCIATLRRLPVGLTEAARPAALEWRFGPLKALTRVRVAVDFSFVLVKPVLVS